MTFKRKLTLIFLFCHITTFSSIDTDELLPWPTHLSIKDAPVPPRAGICYMNNKEWMERCQNDAFDHWHYYQKVRYNEDELVVTRASCCAMWDARDCQIKLAKQRCLESEVAELERQWENAEFIWMRASDCFNYPYHSVNCNFPFWATILIVAGTVLVIILVIYIANFTWRRRSKAKKPDYISVTQK